MGFGALIPAFCIRLHKSPGFIALYRGISSEAYEQGKPWEALELPGQVGENIIWEMECD